MLALALLVSAAHGFGDAAFLRSLAVPGLRVDPAIFQAPAQELGHEAAFELVWSKLKGSGVPEASVRSAFAQAQVLQEVVDRFNKPAEAMPYEQYRKIFLTEANITRGREFLAENRVLLDAVSSKHAGDPGLLVAFVGVESAFGRNRGKFLVFDALYTAVRKIPRRSSWAAGELAALLKLAHADGFDARSVMGSYAGAFGFGQFIPSTFLRAAVDYDGDGRRRWDEWPDVLGSIGNLLRLSGWRRGGDYSRGSANWDAVYAYNHSENYVRVILEMREAVLAP